MLSGSDSDARPFLRSLFDAAVAAAMPGLLLPGRLPTPPPGRVVVVGAGKAAADMARAVEDHWTGPPNQLSGVVVTRHGHGVPCKRIEVVEAEHPVPDERSCLAASRILALAESLGRDDLLLCLLSGGGSSLLALPAPRASLVDKQQVGRTLLTCGARIDEINCVRKHLSAIKGGRLAAAAHPARVITYLISDVPGDDPSMVASGPTITDHSTHADALDVLSRYDIDIPPGARAHLLAGPHVAPKSGHPSFARDEVIVLATARQALAAAANFAASAGVRPLVLGDAIQGEAREVAAAHARLAKAIARNDRPSALAALRGCAVAFSGPAAEMHPYNRPLPTPPCVILSGGETTVTVTGDGRGGRNAEYVLGVVATLGGHQGIWTLAADTDGIDGSEDNAGAVAGPDTLARARAAGVDPAVALARNDAYGFFAMLGDLVVTGPTRTNVNDFRATLILGSGVRGG